MIKKLIDKLKNWWLVILGFLVITLDQGLDFISPILSDLNVSGKWMSYIRILFGFYYIIKLKKSMPTKDPEKLKKLAVATSEPGDGAVQPGKGPEPKP